MVVDASGNVNVTVAERRRLQQYGNRHNSSGVWILSRAGPVNHIAIAIVD